MAKSDLLSGTLLSLALAAALVFGLLYYFFGKPISFDFGGAPQAEKPLCAKDFACAEKHARDLGNAAQPTGTRAGDLRAYGIALSAAYRRKDCELGRELLEGAGRAPAVEPTLIAARRKMVAAHAGACGEPRKPAVEPLAPPPSSTIVLEHAPCVGGCPAYTLTLHPDGRVEWDGKAQVGTKGRAISNVGRNAARQAFDLMEHVHFTTLEKEYLSTGTDLPLVRITLRRPGVEHSVITDGACTSTAAIEAGLCHLIARIDELGGARAFMDARDE